MCEKSKSTENLPFHTMKWWGPSITCASIGLDWISLPILNLSFPVLLCTFYNSTKMWANFAENIFGENGLKNEMQTVLYCNLGSASVRSAIGTEIFLDPASNGFRIELWRRVFKRIIVRYVWPLSDFPFKGYDIFKKNLFWKPSLWLQAGPPGFRIQDIFTDNKCPLILYQITHGI